MQPEGSSAAPLRTVWFEETGERRDVVAVCKGACRLTEHDVRDDPHFAYVVSPSGVAHLTDTYGDTDCGHDATRDGWWWPL